MCVWWCIVWFVIHQSWACILMYLMMCVNDDKDIQILCSLCVISYVGYVFQFCMLLTCVCVRNDQSSKWSLGLAKLLYLQITRCGAGYLSIAKCIILAFPCVLHALSICVLVYAFFLSYWYVTSLWLESLVMVQCPTHFNQTIRNYCMYPMNG